MSHVERGYKFGHECQVRVQSSGSAAELPRSCTRRWRGCCARLCGSAFAAASPFRRWRNCLRELYVNVAEHDFALEGKEQTDSRVSLLTGIHRKEVARLRGRARR